METPAQRGNAAVICALFTELDRLGVTEYCVAAGARNAPLLAALSQRQPAQKFLHFFDERSAAFFALGRVMATRKPVAVLTTSGTAVAELLPAVIEAHYQGLPLVVVTADRPSHYRGSGAPQAIEQPGIFGKYVVREAEIEWQEGQEFQISNDIAIGGGPMHFNACLEEGIEATPLDFSPSPMESSIEEEPLCDRHWQDWHEFWNAEGEIVVLAGGIHPDDVVATRDFLLKLNAPVIMEATSNLTDDTAIASLRIHGGEKAVTSLQATRVLRLGSVPSWRWWRDLEKRDEVRVLNISRAPFRGLARSQGVSLVPWRMILEEGGKVQDSKVQVEEGTLAPLLETYPNAEPAWMQHLSRVIGAGATVMIGNSLPIREWNLAAGIPKSGTRFFANRGANGIDGLVSTWLGVSAQAKESWLVVGDLSALYDLSAPWILPQLSNAKRRIVVINNGGGQIFSRVSWLKQVSDEIKSAMVNPHSMSFEPWARLWGMEYRLFTDWQALQDDDTQSAVWEVRPDAAETDAFWKAWQH